jgi:ABC-type sugar transport system substrate-binding protein
LRRPAAGTIRPACRRGARGQEHYKSTKSTKSTKSVDDRIDRKEEEVMARCKRISALCTVLMLSASAATAEGLVDPGRTPYVEALKDKKVVFLPLAMGFDLAEGWTNGVKQMVTSNGGSFAIRDPNWSTSAGAQALTELIGEKPDLIVVHNPDVQSYARLNEKAEKAGIYVIQVNMRSSYSTDAYVGADWLKVGEAEANALVRKCGTGTSGKVAIVQGVLTAATSVYQIGPILDVFAKHPEIKVVSNQARALTATVLQQNPDLCGLISFWDGMALGSSAAIREAGMTGKVYVVTNGGGEQMACDNLTNGNFDEYVSFDVPRQATDMGDAIKILLQSKQKPGTFKVSLYTPNQILTKADVKPGACWSMKDLPK